MGIKEDIEAIKQDIVGEEQFFEQYVKAERFFKKYKEKLKALTMIATAFATYFIITNSLEANRIEKTNALYLEYSQSKNKTTLSKIKNISPKLYDLILLKDISNNKEITNLIAFHSQQAVEKTLKAYLEFQNRKVPRIHKIQTLIDMVNIDFEVYDELN